MKTTLSTLAIAFTLAAITPAAMAQTKTAPLSNPKYDATLLVRSAFRNLDKNYCTTSNFVSAYYKETITKDNKAISLNEAILDINKASYMNAKSDQVIIKNVRGSNPALGIDPLLVKLQGGPNTALKLDIMKYPFLGCDSDNLTEYYTFEYEAPVNIDNKLFYVVRFDQKYPADDALFRVKMYIEANSFAIGKVEFAMHVERRGDAYLNFIKDKPSHLRIAVKSANYTVGYKEYEGKWYYDYSRSDVKFSASSKKRSINSEYMVSSKMVITDFNCKGYVADKGSIMKSTDILAEKKVAGDDSLIWELYDELMLLALL